MTPNRLVLSRQALADIASRGRILRAERGADFALAWTGAFLDWLDALARGGARIGTAHPRHPAFRSFGYRRQATVLAEFEAGEMRIVRVYFAGQDWQV